MNPRRVVFLFALIVGVAACATTSSGDRSGGSSTVMLAEEIASLGVTNAYYAVERGRPQWLNTRTTTMSSPEGAEPVVYVDGIRVGELRELLAIRADVVVRMEYMRPPDATNRFGTNHDGGAILVTTR